MKMVNKLENVSGPDRVELIPGLIVEDKLRIKTQRRLEKHFNMPIETIFSGTANGGVNWAFMDNMIPLITIMAKQVKDDMTEEMVENLIEKNPNVDGISEKIQKIFLGDKDPENFQNPPETKNQ